MIVETLNKSCLGALKDYLKKVYSILQMVQVEGWENWGKEEDEVTRQIREYRNSLAVNRQKQSQEDEQPELASNYFEVFVVTRFLKVVGIFRCFFAGYGSSIDESTEGVTSNQRRATRHQQDFTILCSSDGAHCCEYRYPKKIFNFEGLSVGWKSKAY